MRVIFLVLLNLMFFECFSESFEICSKKEFEKMYLDRCSLDDNGDLFQQIIIDYPNMSKEDIYLKIELFFKHNPNGSNREHEYFEFADKQSGRLIVKENVVYDKHYGLGVRDTYTIRYSIIIDVKDHRVRLIAISDTFVTTYCNRVRWSEHFPFNTAGKWKDTMYIAAQVFFCHFDNIVDKMKKLNEQQYYNDNW